MRRYYLMLTALAGLVLLGWAAGVAYRSFSSPVPGAAPQAMQVLGSACQTTQEACRAQHPELGELALRFPQHTFYLQLFPAEVRLERDVRAVRLDFVMLGMDMGKNTFVLQADPAEPHRWQGQVMLPLCVTGRADWQVSVQIETGAGQHYTATFPLEIGTGVKR